MARELARRFNRTPLPTLLLAAAVAAACGAVVHHRGYVLLCGLIGAVATGLVWPWLSVRPLRATLSFPSARGVEGTAVRVCLSVRNRGPFPACGLTIAGIGGEAAGLVAVPPFSTREVAWDFVPPSRGAYPQGPVRVSCGFPFGLWHPERPIAFERPILVWPAVTPCAPYAEKGGDPSPDRHRASARAGTGGDPLGVRPYRRGDPPKLLHRGQTARHDRLIVRETAAATRHAVRLVLDTSAASYAGTDGGPDGPREWAIRAAASLYQGWTAQGVNVSLVVEGGVVAAASNEPRAVFDRLARVGEAGGPPAAQLLASAPCRNWRGPLVVITSDTAARAAAAHAEDRVRWVALTPEFKANAVLIDDQVRAGRRLPARAGAARLELAAVAAGGD